MPLDQNKPKDGAEYGDKLLSVPVVLEYDAGTGAYKIVTNSEQDANAIDAFGRMRVSNPETLFDGQFRFHDASIHWFGDMDGGTGTHLSDQAAFLLTADADQSAAIQTRAYFPYQAGKSQLIQFTGVYPVDSGATARIGYFDSDDGVFFQMKDGAPSFVRRTSTSGAPVDSVYAQSGWNIDKFDGSGPSGVSLIRSAPQNIFIDLQWLGVGRVRFGFDIGGVKLYAHKIDFANFPGTAPYMRRGALPFRYELVGASGLVGTAELTAICATVISEGGIQSQEGHPFNVARITPFSVNAAHPVISIRPRLLFHGVAPRLHIDLRQIAAYSSGNNDAYFWIVYGGTLTGASWADVNTEHSGVEYDVAASALSGGISMASMFVPSGTGVAAGASDESIGEEYIISLDPDNLHPTFPFSDVFTLMAMGIGGATDVAGALTWSELH